MTDEVYPRMIGVWIAGHPNLRDQPAHIYQFIQAVRQIAVPEGAGTIYTNEPCYYRDTPTGHDAFRRSLEAKCVDFLTINPDRLNAGIDQFGLLFSLGNTHPIAKETLIELRIRVEEARVEEYLPPIVQLVTHWFDRLRAAAAGISVFGDLTGDFAPDPQRGKWMPKYQREWHDVQRCALGIFWGNALGLTLCDQLGGKAAVINNAPAWRITPLQTGVWLQLSEQPPVDCRRRMSSGPDAGGKVGHLSQLLPPRLPRVRSFPACATTAP